MTDFRLHQRLIGAAMLSAALTSLLLLEVPQVVQAKSAQFGSRTKLGSFNRFKFVGSKTRLNHTKPNFGHFKLGHFRIGKGFPNPHNNPPPNTTPPPTVNVVSFGAKGDGKTDDLAAINAAVAAAVPNGTVYFPPGTYAVSGTISLSSQNAVGAGPSSIILETNASCKTIFFLTVSGGIYNLQLNANSTQTDGIEVQDVTQYSYAIQQITSQGMFKYVISLKNASQGAILSNSLNNTLNGGPPQSYVTIGDSCNNLQINGNTFATECVFGIFAQPTTTGNSSTNLTISNNQMTAVLVHALYLSGVNNCLVSSNNINFTSWTGSPPSAISVFGSPVRAGTGPCNNVAITSNTIIRCGASKSGAIVLAGAPNGSQPGLMNVSATNNNITMIPIPQLFNFSFTSGIYCYGAAGGIGNLTITGNTMTGSGYSGITVNSCANGNISNNSITDGQGEGIYLGNSNAGTFTISGNTMSNLGSAEPNAQKAGCSVRAAIDVDQGSASTAEIIKGDDYNAPANGLQYFIYCSAPKAQDDISGNQTDTMLPTFIAN